MSNTPKIVIEFRDPGSRPVKVEVTSEAEVTAALAEQAKRKTHTRAFISRPGQRRDFFVRELGLDTWHDWNDMTPAEQRAWREQDEA